jgi:hypothetical protein
MTMRTASLLQSFQNKRIVIVVCLILGAVGIGLWGFKARRASEAPSAANSSLPVDEEGLVNASVEAEKEHRAAIEMSEKEKAKIVESFNEIFAKVEDLDKQTVAAQRKLLDLKVNPYWAVTDGKEYFLAVVERYKKFSKDNALALQEESPDERMSRWRLRQAITSANTLIACYDSSDPMAGTTLGAITRALLEYDQYRESIKGEFIKMRKDYGVSDASVEAVAAATGTDTLIAAFRRATETNVRIYQQATAQMTNKDSAFVSYVHDTADANAVFSVARTYSYYATKQYDGLVDRRRERWEQCQRTLQLLPYNSEEKKALAKKLTEQSAWVRDEEFKIRQQEINAHLRQTNATKWIQLQE